MEALVGKSLDLTKHNLNQLKEIFPEVFCEDKIDFDMLRLLLGDNVEDKEERYEFNWYGKSNAIRLTQTPSTGTLRPDRESSKNWDDTENLYIEGDNLEVLKLLQKSYFGKVKMIYIDPPYNTGKDFIYKDDFRDNIANYKDITSQTTRTNPETNGRYHTDWLNMMYPRLKLARNLLTNDGGIFVSIDYNEFANMKKIMDEIFGEDNFQREIIWRIGWLSGYKTTTPNFIRNHDTILFYSKDHTQFSFEKKYILNKDFKPLVKKDSSISSKMESLGLSRNQQDDLIRFINYENRPEKYPIEDTWNCNEYDDLNSIAIVSFSGEKISKILGINQDFKGQKSIKMLQRLIVSLTKENDIILDFFSGTSSTAHAIIQQNIEDDYKRKFIMVQIPEIIDKEEEAYNAGYKNICEIGKERIRRAGEKIVEENKNTEGIENLDIGFKVFTLDSSNLKSWDSSIENLEQNLLNMDTNLKKDRMSEDLLYEILLKSGIELTAKIEEIKIGYNTIYNIGEGALLACLDDKITQDVIDEIPKHKSEFMETKVIFKEAGFMSDASKINAIQNLKQFKIEDVRSV